jgi:hypothetical protein
MFSFSLSYVAGNMDSVTTSEQKHDTDTFVEESEIQVVQIQQVVFCLLELLA